MSFNNSFFASTVLRCARKSSIKPPNSFKSTSATLTSHRCWCTSRTWGSRPQVFGAFDLSILRPVWGQTEHQILTNRRYFNVYLTLQGPSLHGREHCNDWTNSLFELSRGRIPHCTTNPTTFMYSQPSGSNARTMTKGYCATTVRVAATFLHQSQSKTVKVKRYCRKRKQSQHVS